MSNIYDRREGESIADYKERLYKNRSIYGLEWEDVTTILKKEENPDHTRKTSYGYLERIEDEKNSNKFDKSVMIINDIHVPYEREDVLEIISKHADEITTLVINGDFMDCESISSFPKINRITLEEEIAYAHQYLNKIRKILNKGQKIILNRGNHEERLYRDICNMHQKNLQKFINPEIIDMLIEGFTIYDDGKKVKYKGIENTIYVPNFYINIDNKLIVAHPKDFSAVDGKMCEKTSEHFLNQGENFEVIVFGHTHKYSQMTVSRRQNTYVVENGCLCKPMEYAGSGKLGYTPQHYCYTIIKYNDNEKIKYDNIKVYHLDEIYDKKEDFKIEL